MTDPQALRVAIADALEQAGHPDLAKVARQAADELEKDRPTIYDRHGFLDQWHDARDAIERWIADPAPKLAGIQIRVRSDPGYPGEGLGMEIRLSKPHTLHDGRAGEVFEMRVINPPILVQTRDIDGMIFHTLEGMHRRMIEHIRNNR